MTYENPFNSTVEAYEEWFKINDKIFQTELQAVGDFIPKKGKGIEIGVGTGLFASNLGIKYGVESSENMATEAKRKGITVFQGKAEALPIENKSFDYALMVTVDCFLDNVATAFKEIERIIKDDGKLIIAFLDKNTPLGEMYEKNKHSSESYKHANFHSASEIKLFLENENFVILEAKQTIFTLDNTLQEIKPGTGEGIFTVFLAKKKSKNFGHTNNHSHLHTHHQGQNNIKTAFFLNLFFTVIEVIGGLWTNSMAILSDALHDLGDSISLGIAWYLAKFSQRSPDDKFTYGYARFSLLGALINGTVLVIGSAIILFNAIPRLFKPEEVNPTGMLFLAILGIAVNGFAAMKLYKSSSLNEKMVSWHLLEDVLGWAAVLIASIIMKFINIPVLDTVLSILITLFVLFNVIKNLREVFRVFLQGVPPNVSISQIQSDIILHTDVISVHHTHIWSLEGEKIQLSTHVIVDNDTSPQKIIFIKREIRRLMREKGIDHVTIEVDYKNEGCTEESCR